MPERRNIGAALGAGNFGSSGTPLGLTPQKQGPDFGRLLSALGVAAKDKATVDQQRDVSAAELAIREAHLKTKAKLKGETPDQHRARKREAVQDVRKRFSDQSIFMKAFTNENVAVKAADELNGRLRAQEYKNSASELYHSMKDASLTERQAALNEMMFKESSQLRAMSDATHKSFIKNIADFTLGLHDKIEVDTAERAKQKALVANFNTHTLESVGGVETLGERTVEQINDNLDDFNAFHTNIDANSEEFIEGLRTQAIDVFRKNLELTNGDRVSAGKQTSDFLVSMAKRYNRPEVLDIGSKPFDSSGTTLEQFHGALFEDTRAQVTSARARQAEQLRTKQLQDTKRTSQAQYSDTLGQVSRVVDAAVSSEDPTLTHEAFGQIEELQEELRKGGAAGDYRGNEVHYQGMMKMLNYHRSLLISSDGIPENEDEFNRLVHTREFNLDAYNRISHGLSDKTKNVAKGLIAEEVRNLNAADAKRRTLEAQAHNFERYEPMNDAIQQFANWKANPVHAQSIKAALASGKDLSGLDTSDLQRRVQRAQQKFEADILRKARETGQPPVLPTAAELAEVSQPIVDDYMKQFTQFTTQVSTQTGGIKKRMEEELIKSRLVKSEDDVAKFNKVISEVAHDNVFFDKTHTNEEVQMVYQAAEAGLAPKKAVKNALIADLRNTYASNFGVANNNAVTPTQLLNHISKVIEFDPGNPNDVETMADILDKSANDLWITQQNTEGQFRGQKFSSPLGPALASRLRSTALPLWSEAGMDDFFNRFGLGLPKNERKSMEALFNKMFLVNKRNKTTDQAANLRRQAELDLKRAQEALKRITEAEKTEDALEDAPDFTDDE